MSRALRSNTREGQDNETILNKVTIRNLIRLAVSGIILLSHIYTNCHVIKARHTGLNQGNTDTVLKIKLKRKNLNLKDLKTRKI